MVRAVHDISQQNMLKKILVIHPYPDMLGGGEEVLLKILEVLIERKQNVSLLGELPLGSIFDNLPISSIKQIPIGSKENFKHFAVYRNLFSQLKRQRSKLRREVGEIDLEISTQETMFFIGDGKKHVTYVHFPETLSRMKKTNLKYRWFWKLYYWPITFHFSRQIKKIDLLICNSIYTQKAIMDYWGRDAVVIYPPVDVGDFKPVQKEFLVVSVGRFDSTKNYELIVEVARRMPDVKFAIAGRKRLDDPYFDKIAGLKPDNLELIADATRGDIAVLLGRAKVYLHGMVGEHFGISVGEAMAAGCVPVVHDSGGPREIVGEFGLFYSSVDECVKVVGEALQSSMDSCVIADRVRMFGADVFKKNFIELLEKKCLL